MKTGHKISVLTIVLLTTLGQQTLAQRSQRQLTIPQRTRKFYQDEPRTRLEEIQDRLGQVILKGFMNIGEINGRNGSAEVSAVELRSTAESNRASGLVIEITEARQSAIQIQSFIDYEEIDPLIAGLDATYRANDTITKMPNFSASYRTRDDFGIVVFKQTRSGLAARLESTTINETGGIERVAIVITLDELNRLRGLILEAKQRLDELR
jgi:bifunctional DNA-binding transcriptional regulator/antitoxin component of YhaV-PrlF toxin-antitoxin module